MLFVVQAVLFVWGESCSAVCRSFPRARGGRWWRGSSSWYSLLYPAMNAVQHLTVSNPPFRNCCPTTIFTVGFLMLASLHD